MDSPDRTELEESIRVRAKGGDAAGAATVAVRGFGPEILGFLVAMSRSDEDGAEAFAMFSEDLWRGLPAFRWGCSFRTWAYTLARHALVRLADGQRRRAARQVALSDCPELAELTARVRTETLTYLRTETKSKVAELRASLPEEDKALLILRVDRGLAWSELARVMLEPHTPNVDDAALIKREAARLRKRFQLVKARLLSELGHRVAEPKETSALGAERAER